MKLLTVLTLIIASTFGILSIQQEEESYRTLEDCEHLSSHPNAKQIIISPQECERFHGIHLEKKPNFIVELPEN